MYAEKQTVAKNAWQLFVMNCYFSDFLFLTSDSLLSGKNEFTVSEGWFCWTSGYKSAEKELLKRVFFLPNSRSSDSLMIFCCGKTKNTNSGRLNASFFLFNHLISSDSNASDFWPPTSGSVPSSSTPGFSSSPARSHPAFRYHTTHQPSSHT